MCHPFFAILPSDVSCYIADAYYTQESYESLNTVDDFPELAEIQVPPNQYVCARNNGARRNVRNGSGGAGGGYEHALPSLTYRDTERSPALSSNSSTESFPSYVLTASQVSPYPPPPSSSPESTGFVVPPAVPLRTGFPLGADRRLAPLEYLQNISPRARNPADDEALRQFQCSSTPL